MTHDSDHSTRDPSQDDPPESDQTTRAFQTTSSEHERIDHYRILEQVGEGGMGKVYRAEQTDPVRRMVALKIIKPGMDTKEVIRRFEAERQALALMDHPNIAKVYDAGSTPDGRPYFVMEYVRGLPMTKYADRHKLSLRRRLELFLQLCEGVQHAHQKAIIHRDLKPSNVLVTSRENQPVPKIIDFGVAKATAQKLTEETVYTALGVLIGTPEYMSPEQAEMTGENIDTRSDVYSLGVILYELLAGALPFGRTELREAGVVEIIRMIREQDPPLPSTRVTVSDEQAIEVARARRLQPDKLRGQLRGDLDWITMQALEKDRTLRYGSAAELAADIQRHLKHEPVLAGPPSTLYRARKFVRRNRTGVAFAAVLVLVLAGFAVTMAVQTGRVADERDRANAEAERANREAQAADEVTGFLVDLFDVSDPRVHRGDKMTAWEILELAVERIDEIDAPLQQARLLDTMGRVHQHQGLYEETAKLLEKSLSVRRREQGDRHPDVARTLAQLGWLRGAYQRRPLDAKPYLLEALDIQEEVFGRDHVETGWTLYYLGSSMSFGQDPCGLDYLHRARVIFEDSLGAESLPVAWCWNDIGNALLNEGEYQRGLESYQASLDIKEQHLPPNHPDLGTALLNVGEILVLLHRCEAAQRVLERALQIQVDALGRNHDSTADVLLSLSRAHRCQEDYAEAQEKLAQAMEIFRETQGEEYELFGSALHEQALIALETGQDAEADGLLRRAQGIVADARGSDSPLMAKLMEDRAGSLRKVGRELEAVALEDSVRAIRTRWKEQAAQCDTKG